MKPAPAPFPARPHGLTDAEYITLLEDQLGKAIVILRQEDAGRAALVERLERQYRDRYELERSKRFAHRRKFLTVLGRLQGVLQQQQALLERHKIPFVPVRLPTTESIFGDETPQLEQDGLALPVPQPASAIELALRTALTPAPESISTRITR